MLSFLIGAIKIFFILGFLVLIHEGGHFIVAKLCKIKVNEFAIGFGPTIWKMQGKETKYALRLIPLGGFVSMEGEEERSEKEGSFSNSSIPKRIAVVVAGGFVNIIFALITYFILMSCVGNNISNIIENPIEGKSASLAGLQAGDKITKINGKSIINKKDFDEALEKSGGKELTVEVERNGEKLKYTFMPDAEKYNYTGIAIKTNEEKKTTEIAGIYPKTPAEIAGLQNGDIITKINNINVKNNPEELVNSINQAENTEILFTVERKNESIEIMVNAEKKYNYYLGVYLKTADKNLGNNLYYAFFETGDFAFSIVDNVKMLFTGNVSINQLMGPVGIGEVVVETSGIVDFIYILALISISLGVTNLLPFPPLDGGKVVILLIEAIRRKPLKEKTEMGIQTAGFLILISLSIFVAYNDVLRLF